MIRPFHLRDMALVHRLSEQGVVLNTKFALTSNRHPLRGALSNMLVGGQFPTFVWKTEERDAVGFAQLSLDQSQTHAEIIQVAIDPGSHTGDSLWLSLLDQLVAEAGSKGIQSLVAEVGETGKELPLLRLAGFAVYTRQMVWIIDQFEGDGNDDLLKPREEIDDWDIQLLYAHIVPRMVEMIEPMPAYNDGQSWVLREGNEMVAFVHAQDGANGNWLRFFIHPNTETPIEQIVAAAVHANPPQNNHPIYCCVRRYQSWLQDALVKTGFSEYGSQAVMVKHTVNRLQNALPDLAATVQAKAVTGSSPAVQRYKYKSNGHDIAVTNKKR